MLYTKRCLNDYMKYMEIFIAGRQYKKAEKELLAIYAGANESRYRLRSLYLLGVIYVYNYNWG
jgi:hypothetical protein